MTRLYNPNEDLEQVNLWLIAHNQIPCEKSDLPGYGVIEDGVAVGFLCQTDTKTCFIDPMISNKEASSEDRNAALNDIIIKLGELAKTMGYKRLLFMTAERSLQERGSKLGFTVTQNMGFGFKEL